MRTTEEILKSICPEIHEETVWVDMQWCSDAKTSKDLDYTISTYRWLLANLEYDELCERVNTKLDELRDNEETTYDAPYWDSECLDMFKDALEFTEEAELIENEHQCNTYNHDSHLSDVIQYTAFEIDGEYYAFVCVHQCGDVRGNYSSAFMFKLRGDFGCPIIGTEDVYGSIDDIPVSNVYDGFHLYADENCDADEVELKREVDPEDEDETVIVSEINLYITE